MHWGPDWTEPPVELFRQRTQEALQGNRWVADGNYGKVRDLVWGRAETLVWLDYALPLARGELLVIYDAEDVPAPDQLRKAAARFAAGKGYSGITLEYRARS